MRATSTFRWTSALLLVTAAGAAVADVTPLEEVTVSAQRREQDLQAVPVTVSVLSGERLAELNLANSADIARYTANLNIRNTIGDALPTVTIRGVGNVASDINKATNSPSAAFHVDDVYLGSASLLSFQMLDVERVEVLKGPQGTLFGRNTTAGTVSFISRKPQREPGASVQVGYDSFGVLNIQGHATGPLSDTVSARIALAHTRGDSYMSKPNGDPWSGPDRLAVRTILQWDLSDQTRLLLNANYGSDKSAVSHPHLIGYRGARCAFIATGVQDPTNCPDGTGAPTFADRYRADGSRKDRFDIENIGASVRLDTRIGKASLVSITAVQSLDSLIPEEADSSAIPGFFEYNDRSKIDQYSQEFRLSADSSWGFWTLGVFAFREEVSSANNNFLLGGPLNDPASDATFAQDTTSQALFGQIEWTLTERLRLTTGLRYTGEKKSLAFEGSFGNFFGGTIIGIPPTVPFYDPTRRRYIVIPQLETSESWSNVSGTLNLSYQTDSGALLFGNVRSGYKSGLFNVSPFSSASAVRTPADPEKLIAYEIGAKTEWLDGSLRLNASAFYYDFRDLQVSSIVVIASQPQSTFTNADKARIVGGDLDLEWRLNQSVGAFASLGVARGEFTDFTTLDAGTLARRNRSGTRLPNNPRFTASGGLRGSIDAGPGRVTGLLSFHYRSEETFTYLTERPLDRWFRRDGVLKMDARLAWSNSTDTLELAIYGENLTDKEVPYQMFDGLDSAVEYMEPPRRFGVSVRWTP